MSTLNNRLRILALSVTTILTVAAGSTSLAGPLALSDSPVFLMQGVEPNLIMAIDDSTSMDFEVLLRGNDGSAWWRSATLVDTCTAATGRSFVGCVSDGSSDIPGAGQLNFNNDGNSSSTWRKYSYLFPNGSSSADTSFRRRAGDADNDHFAIPPLPAFAWSRSPDYNKAYFNPALTYAPWPNGGGYTFTDAPPTAARFDPVFGLATDAIDLTSDFAGTGSASTTAACDSALPGVAGNYYFRVQTGMTIPAGACIRQPVSGADSEFGTNDRWEVVRSEGCVIGATDQCLTVRGGTDRTRTIPGNSGVAIRYFPATFYVASATSLPAGFGWKTTATTLSGTAPDGTSLIGYEIKPANFDTPAQYNAAIQNFANWFSYSRKRHQALRAGLGNAFLTIAGMRVSGFTINNNTADVTMGSIDDVTHRTTMYTNFYRDFVQSGGTPNRNAVYNIVRNYKRTGAGAPIQYACQKNFGMLFTDGFSNLGGGFDTIGNIDGGKGAPYEDNVSHTLADGVMDAYINDLRTDLGLNKIVVPDACDDASPPLGMDCRKSPHMNFYAVTLGTRGIQFNPDAVPAQNPYLNPPTWPTAFFARHPSAVDDIWHATVNGRGKLLNAKSADELSTKLSEVLQSVKAESASASSASVSSGSIRSNTQVFQAKFKSDDWTGELLSYTIATDGTGSLSPTATWTKGAASVPASGRKIFTVLSDGSKAEFAWDATAVAPAKALSLDTVRIAELGASAADAEKVVNYIRGDNANEGTAAGTFRVRKSLLGDIINSSPVYVGPPRYSYGITFPDKGYNDFKKTNATRGGAVYVGANDGMLHAFDTSNGKELFAYVPGVVTKNLKLLTSQTYDQSHKYFVDGSPNSGDVYIGGKWRTVIVGGLNHGGQAIYALDVTDPTKMSTSDVLWEFTHNDLGYTYSQPQIVRLENGKWGAVFGNGYNSSETDGSQGSGVAQLFIVDIETGTLIRSITTGAGDQTTPNGLATPTVVDDDGDSIADYAYAGDLLGNVWKFDLNDKNDANWKVSYASGGNPQPLYVAADASSNRQPITSRMDVARGPGGVGMLVLFGTGKFVEIADRSTKATQTFYGIYDPNGGQSTDPFTGRATTDLRAQTVTSEVSAATTKGLEVRVTSSNNPGTRGWYMDLLPSSGTQNGERVVSNATYRDGRIIFATVIPSSDICDSGGDSWIMEIDALTGKRLGDSPVDTNRDGKIDAADMVTDGTGSVAPGGFKSDVGIVSGVGIAADPVNPVEFKYMAGSKGQMQTVRESSPAKSRGRQSWRAVR